jgi:hypothetical protein
MTGIMLGLVAGGPHPETSAGFGAVAHAALDPLGAGDRSPPWPEHAASRSATSDSNTSRRARDGSIGASVAAAAGNGGSQRSG